MQASPDEPVIATSVDSWLRIVSAMSSADPDFPACLANLALALQARSEHTGAQADLDMVIEIFRAVTRSARPGDPEGANYLSNLGNVLRIRFERSGVLADLDEAVSVGQAAVAAAPADCPGRAAMLSNVGVALRARFERSGDRADLDDAIAAGRAALAADQAADQADDPSRIGYLSNLGAVLRARFERSGDIADLDEAITAGRTAVAMTRPDYPHRAACLANLGAALKVRFEQRGASTDLDEAIAACRAAVAGTAEGHPGRPVILSNLGTVLQARFARTDALADLDEAITAGKAAVAASGTGHTELPRCLSNLGAALQAMYDRTGDLADLDEAVAACRAAVATCPVGHPGLAGYLSNLTAGLVLRFGRTSSAADLDEAITAGRAAVAAVGADQPRRARHLSNLTGALAARFARTQDAADRVAAFQVAAEAAKISLAAPSVRIPAARAAALLAANFEPDRAADLLEMAVRLLPEMTPTRLGRDDKQAMLRGVAGLAGEAAALALEATASGTGIRGRATRALRLLEAGRAVLLGQLLDTRSDLTDLRRSHPDLASRFESLRDELDQQESDRPPMRGTPVAAVTGDTPGQPGRRLRDRSEPAAELASLVERIRALAGFAGFALPPAVGELLAEARHGPVVALNVSIYRSDALLLTKDGITSLELPNLSHIAVIERIGAFRGALDAIERYGMTSARGLAAQVRMSEILAWLWDSAAGPVLDSLGYDGERVAGEDMPRVWWAPGGLLSMLPIHAAGHHDDPRIHGRRTVMDRIVSSYTPTVRALRYARQRSQLTAGQSDRSLIIAMPITPGLPGELRHARAEADLLAGLLPAPILLTASPGSPTAGPAAAGPLAASTVAASTVTVSPATKANVLAQLRRCAIVHFACHGDSHPNDPSSSRLLLSDHASDPLTVASLVPVNLDHAQLAYLSACRTAYTPATKLIDEAIHLTTAFQMAGFPHVIGTLWEIDDAISVCIAQAVYSRMRTSDGVIDTAQAAAAVHGAVLTVRDEFPDLPFLWAAYLHAGA